MKPGVTAQPDASSSRSPREVRPDLADHAVGDRDVGDAAGRAAAVEDGSPRMTMSAGICIPSHG